MESSAQVLSLTDDHRSYAGSLFRSKFVRLLAVTAVFCIAFVAAVDIHSGLNPQIRRGPLVVVVEHNVLPVYGQLPMIGSIDPTD